MPPAPRPSGGVSSTRSCGRVWSGRHSTCATDRMPPRGTGGFLATRITVEHPTPIMRPSSWYSSCWTKREVARMPDILAPGTRVEWDSHGGGYWKRKRGVVVAYVPWGKDAFVALADAGESGRLMGQRRSIGDRYIVREIGRATCREKS